MVCPRAGGQVSYLFRRIGGRESRGWVEKLWREGLIGEILMLELLDELLEGKRRGGGWYQDGRRDIWGDFSIGAARRIAGRAGVGVWVVSGHGEGFSRVIFVRATLRAAGEGAGRIRIRRGRIGWILALELLGESLEGVGWEGVSVTWRVAEGRRTGKLIVSLFEGGSRGSLWPQNGGGEMSGASWALKRAWRSSGG